MFGDSLSSEGEGEWPIVHCCAALSALASSSPL
jgi:hypothetical protein